nr:MAG TPA: hypothetical protein [Caudoviricetes sp.]
MEKYDVLIINSNNIYDYVENTAEGIRFKNISRMDLDDLLRMSMEQNFTIVIQNCEEEE